MKNEISEKVIAELNQLSILLGESQIPLNTIEKEKLNKILSYLPVEHNLLFLQSMMTNGRTDLLHELQNDQVKLISKLFMKSFLLDKILESSSQISEIRKKSH